MNGYRRDDAIEVRHGSGVWVPGRVTRAPADPDPFSFYDLVLIDGTPLFTVPSAELRPAPDDAVPTLRGIFVGIALLPTALAPAPGTQVLPAGVRCEAPAYTRRPCGALRERDDVERYIVQVHHRDPGLGRGLESWPVVVLGDGWTVNDVAGVILCPEHSRTAHPWISAFLREEHER